MKLLAIESTCDETAAAVVTDRLEVLGSAVASQDPLHERYGGVVPEIASRAHVERMVPVIDLALARAGTALGEIDAIAVAVTPGLAGSLLVGLSAAKTLALVLGVPLVGVNHLQAHVYACRIASGEEIFPCVALVVSGGHTSLYRASSPLQFELLGGTIDDAAGEAFDKVAAMLGLSYPGGPAIEKAARGGDPKAYRLPRAFSGEPDRLQFSFSGLKTAVRYKLCGPGAQDFRALSIPPQQVANLAASFQEAVVDILVEKTHAALRRCGATTLCVAGGVAANGRLRERMEQLARDHNVRLHVPPLALCTDNAVMVAIAVERLRAGNVDALDLDIAAGLVRE